jgi:hypothetical protein
MEEKNGGLVDWPGRRRKEVKAIHEDAWGNQERLPGASRRILH